MVGHFGELLDEDTERGTQGTVDHVDFIGIFDGLEVDILSILHVAASCRKSEMEERILSGLLHSEISGDLILLYDPSLLFWRNTN